MAIWMTSAVGLAVLNVLLLAVLLSVWLSNYRTFRSPMLLGLLLFAGLLAVENTVAIAGYLSTEMVYAGGKTAMYTIVALRALQFAALGFLTMVTLFPSGKLLRSGARLDKEDA